MSSCPPVTACATTTGPCAAPSTPTSTAAVPATATCVLAATPSRVAPRRSCATSSRSGSWACRPSPASTRTSHGRTCRDERVERRKAVSDKADLPDLLYSDTEQALAASLGSLLADRGSLDKVLARTESTETYDDGLWQAVAGDLGCAGLLIPERDGGAGASYKEVCSAAEALGSTVAPVPFLGSAVVATTALLSVASGIPADAATGVPRSSASVSSGTPFTPARAAADLLHRMADGSVTVTLAVPFACAPGGPFPVSVRVAGPRPGDAQTGIARLRGTVSGVADALPATVLLVPADGVPNALYLVDMS